MITIKAAFMKVNIYYSNQTCLKKKINFRPHYLLFTLLLILGITSVAKSQKKEWDKSFGGVYNPEQSKVYGASYLETVLKTSNGFLLGGRSNSSPGNDKTESRRGD